MKIRYEEGSYDGEVNDAKTPEGKGTFEYRSDQIKREIYPSYISIFQSQLILSLLKDNIHFLFSGVSHEKLRVNTLTLIPSIQQAILA